MAQRRHGVARHSEVGSARFFPTGSARAARKLHHPAVAGWAKRAAVDRERWYWGPVVPPFGDSPDPGARCADAE